jgi:hypothetical protein
MNGTALTLVELMLLVGRYKAEISLSKLPCFTAKGVKNAVMGDKKDLKVIVGVKRCSYLAIEVKVKVGFVLLVLVFVKSAAHIMELGSVNVV